MSKDRPTPGGRSKRNTEVSLVRSSAAEYLTFVAASGSGGVEAVYADENVWLSQKMMGQLYDVETHTINYHLKKVFADSELQEDSVVRNLRITAADGKTYDTQHYKLSAIIAVGYKVNSERAVQFRKWILRAPELETRALRWKVAFTARLPFGEENATLEAKTQFADRRQRANLDLEFLRQLSLGEESELNHRGVTEAQSADRPGEFKYDLIVQDAITGEHIGDDDPWLIVVRGVLRPFDLYVF